MPRLLKPTTLAEAFEIAVVQEQSLDVLSKKMKMVAKVGMDVPKSGSITISDHKGSGSTIGKAKLKEAGEFKKLTPQEIQYRRNNHLCFKCGDRYSPGHQCKFANLNFVIAEEEEVFEDAEGEQDDNTGAPGHQIEVSLYPLFDSLKTKTISL